MTILQGADIAYALRFLRLLTMPWEKTEAYKVGVLDKDGKILKKPSTPEEKSAYTIFHRLVFNIRKMVEVVPQGARTVARYLSALWLIRESSSSAVAEFLAESLVDEDILLNESVEVVPGEYTLNHDCVIMPNFDLVAYAGTKVTVTEMVGSIAGIPVFEAHHSDTSSKIFVSSFDLVLTEDQVASSSVALPSSPINQRDVRVFDVSDDTFRRLYNGRKKHSRWKKYLNLEDSTEKAVHDYARSKKGLVLLRSDRHGIVSLRSY